jgi:hypothetical protein
MMTVQLMRLATLGAGGLNRQCGACWCCVHCRSVPKGCGQLVFNAERSWYSLGGSGSRVTSSLQLKCANLGETACDIEHGVGKASGGVLNTSGLVFGHIRLLGSAWGLLSLRTMAWGLFDAGAYKLGAAGNGGGYFGQCTVVLGSW